MIKQVSHDVPGAAATDLDLALEVAYELHAPTVRRRAPEVATPAARPSAARRRRTARA
ncbi:hypothetical protein SSP24_69030 [Streptomyces spinoverrucosus]|uniref:Uncharacterized protein n=1 Tax=Streptomyces spinoverrucosus TaxID=284043 RepID=A0A4Y3VSN9_9ACTN|nr:hypothetical protein [Streptomyces spinoverrucosus]GEC09248.1 hypothetical protein SSP24_69030 [Streptomyces spinoverrucosus]GHB52601.1 hypothetical protein GCM10010397_23160 [Streptomyces spinoverrucosus]